MRRNKAGCGLRTRWMIGFSILILGNASVSACATVGEPSSATAATKWTKLVTVIPEQSVQPESGHSTLKPFEAGRYQVAWQKSEIPREMEAGQTYEIPVSVANSGDALWLSQTDSDPPESRVFLSYHWLSADEDTPVVWDGLRTPLSQPLAPGETFEGDVRVQAPDDAGTFRLQLTLIHEAITWFDAMGADTVDATVAVN